MSASVQSILYLLVFLTLFMVPINLFAVIASAVVMMIIGFLWYGPLFGKPWSKMMGWGEMTPEKMKEMQKKAMPGYAISFVGSLLMAFVFAHALVFADTYLNMSGVNAGLQGAFWNWLGFIVPVTVGVVLWEEKPWTLWFINAGYYLVSLAAMGIILSLWV